MRNTGRVLFAGTVFAVAVTVGAAAFTVEQLSYRAAQADKACQRDVRARDETRLMWEWLVDQFPDSDVAARAVHQLDVRLPHLRCVDDIAVPIEGDSNG
jgi:hypothetical protein